uniref:Uncharacterized protein n=1 Tax=Davidia involucrata TaxID=16924 RepID=A0A5B7BGH2_DAVIN
MRTKASNQNRFMRIITIPIRVLSKARDFYVRSITDCATNVNVGGVPAAGQLPSLPRSFSGISSRSSCDNEDLRELIRAASSRSLGNRVELDLHMQQQQMMMMRQSIITSTVEGPRSSGVPRSSSVGMGRIDEDMPCDFVHNHTHVKPELMLYPRSKSFAAVTKKSDVF